MANPIQRPLAVLLCKFNDDNNNPSVTRLSDLYSQWVAQFGQTWVNDNLLPAAATDQRTILNLYTSFFADASGATFNAVRYWDEMSHGTIDVSHSQVFPITLGLTKAEGAALGASPGGVAYQNAIFQKAKSALSSQYGVDWKNFYGVIVSFQSPDLGAQGGSYDGGPGVYMDIRWVRNQGTAAWGHEMGHAFGMDHSRLNGSNTDYQDMWDIMSALNDFMVLDDPNYGQSGPGLNAWNMRGRNWLDETRVWRPPSSAGFSEFVRLRPLHRRDLSGYLCAELPGIGTDTPYLVEFRVPQGFDGAIPASTILVHRFEGQIGSFMNNRSYVMPGTKGQVGLSAGDIFVKGAGPFSSVKVVSLDETNLSAVVQLCFSLSPKLKPAVKIVIPMFEESCGIPPVEATEARFRFRLSNMTCVPNYKVLWGVTGTSPIPGERNDGNSFSIKVPDPASSVTVTITILFDDGTSISDSYKFNSVTQATATWMLFLCRLKQERTIPIPWWEWHPEKLRGIARDYSKAELKLIAQRTTTIARTLTKLSGLRNR